MRFAFFLAFRYFRQPRRNFLARLTAFAAVCGIAFGTAAMLVALALANGFRQAMQEKMLADRAHVAVFRSDATEISDWKQLAARIKSINGVAAVSAQSFDNALLIGKNDSAVAVLRGSASETASDEGQIANKIKIGRILAQKVGLKLGDAAEIVTSGKRLGEDFAPISTVVEVGAIFETGFYEYDSTHVQLSLADAAKLTGKPKNAAATLAVETTDIYRANETAAAISRELRAEYRVLDWQEANRPLFAALALERRVALAIVGLIVFVAALNIATTLALSIGERRFDIAVLRTCGATAKTIAAIFLLEGLILAFVGLTIGVLLGAAVCFFVNRFDLINLPADVYEVGKISLQTNPTEISLVAALVLLLSFLASWLPARAAARMRPTENLKN